MTALRLIALVMILLAGDIIAVYGQTPSALPSGMTQDQFDAIVDAISKAVVVKQKNEGALPTRVPAVAPSPAGAGSNAVADELAAFLKKAEHLLRAIPTQGTYLTSIPRLLDDSKQRRQGPTPFLLLLAFVAGGSFAAEIVLRKSLSHFRPGASASPLKQVVK